MTAFAADHGLTVTERHAGRRRHRNRDGGQLNAAFGVTLNYYERRGRLPCRTAE